MKCLNLDHLMFIEEHLIVTIYVNDLLIESKNINIINFFKESLTHMFNMSDLESVHHYLSMKVTYNRINRMLNLK